MHESNYSTGEKKSYGAKSETTLNCCNKALKLNQFNQLHKSDERAGEHLVPVVCCSTGQAVGWVKFCPKYIQNFKECHRNLKTHNFEILITPLKTQVRWTSNTIIPNENLDSNK